MQTAAEIDTLAAGIGALCDRVEAIAGAAAAAPADGREEQRLVAEVTGTFARLRQLYRQLSESRAALAAEVAGLKHDTDGLALQVENKRREAAHIQSEIVLTDTLETIYQDIELIPEDEFLQTAPAECTADVGTPHKLLLARLRYEVRQRDELLEAKLRARAQRDGLRVAKRRRIERLEVADGQIQTYIRVAAPLAKSLGVDAGADGDGDGDAEAKAAAGAGAKGAETPRPTRGGSMRMGTPRV